MNIITCDTTYYVRADGSNSNSGLENTACGAFLTVQHAADYVAQNLIIQPAVTVTIKVDAGTFAEAVVVRRFLGGGLLKIEGAGSTTLVTSINSFAGGVQVKDIKLSGGVDCIRATSGGASVSILSGVELGSASNAHLMAYLGGQVEVASGYTVSGNAPFHFQALNGGLISAHGQTVSLGSRSFSVFAFAHMQGAISSSGMSFSGTVSGQRYNGQLLSVISVNGAGGNYFPGTAGGAVSNNSIYA